MNRTTDGKGRVLDFDLVELRRLDAGTWKHPRFAGTRVPTLAEALSAIPPGIWINLDVKADSRFGARLPEVIRQAVTQLSSSGRREQTVLAVRSDAAAVARQAAPGIRICTMDRKPDPGDYVAAAIAQRADFIQLRECAADPRLPGWTAALRRAGIRINYYYSDEPAEVERLRAAGVDFVLMNHVERVLPLPAGR